MTVTDGSGKVYAERTAFTLDTTAGTITFAAARRARPERRW